MTRHLLKLVWNRWRTNLLLVIEVFGCFLVVFPVAGLGLFYWRNANQPLGYDWEDVWVVEIETGARQGGERAEAEARTIEELVRAAEAMPDVRTAAGASVVPFEVATDERSRDGVSTLVDEVTDDFLETLDLELVAGRWFGPEDDGSGIEPVVIDADLAHTLWGDEDPIGRRFPLWAVETVEERVVGVVSEFKKDGELAGPGHFAFYRAVLGDPGSAVLSRIVLEMEPGAGRGVEERVLEALAGRAPEWTLEVKPLAELRATARRLRMAPLLVGGTVGLFLLAMVGLGLTGVLWEAVTRRRSELGLRRALGASRAAVRRQVLTEIALLTGIAVGAGLLVVIQLPLFELVGFLDRSVFAGAVALAVISIFALTLLCGLYPSRLAMAVEPADALRDE